MGRRGTRRPHRRLGLGLTGAALAVLLVAPAPTVSAPVAGPVSLAAQPMGFWDWLGSWWHRPPPKQPAGRAPAPAPVPPATTPAPSAPVPATLPTTVPTTPGGISSPVTTTAPAPSTPATTASSPLTVPAAGPLLGVADGNDPSAVTTFESWLGRPVDLVAAYGGYEALTNLGQTSGWTNFDGSLQYQLKLWNGLKRPVLWSIPLIAKDASLHDAATGAYDSHYLAWAKGLAAQRSERTIYIRTGWEFNGGWFPWTVTGGRSQDFVGAFQHFVRAFRSVDQHRFVFEWNVNIGAQDGNDPELAYPGDDYVDIIGMDFYRNPGWPQQAADSWNWMVTQKYGLQWHQDFAAKHRKVTAYSEWGLQSDESVPYLRLAAAWFRSHPVLYQVYWDSNSAYPGRVSAGQYPALGRSFQDEFGPAS